MKVTGTITRVENWQQGVELEIDIPLRDLFAAFALVAVVGLNLDDATHETDAMYAYYAADAMLSERDKDRSAKAEVNARLIAAAPALYEAATVALGQLERSFREIEKPDQAPEFYDWSGINKLRAALRLAE